MASAIAGAVGGSLATLVMTAPMMLLGDGGPPQTAALVENVAGGDPGDHAMPGMVLQLGYGIVHVAYGFDLGTGVLA